MLFKGVKMNKILKFISAAVAAAVIGSVLCSCNLGIENKDYDSTAASADYFTLTLIGAEESGYYSIAAKDINNLPETLALPRTYKGMKVKEIGVSGFAYSGIKKLIIPETYNTVGLGAFSNCDNLTDVTMYDGGVQNIGYNAFEGCEKLYYLSFSNNLKKISQYAFGNCSSLTKVSFAEVKEIGSKAFKDCVSLKTVYIPSTTLLIADDTFYGCDKVAFTISAANDVYKVVDNTIVKK